MKCKYCSKQLENGHTCIIINDEIICKKCEEPYRRFINGLIYTCPRCKGTGSIKTGKTEMLLQEVYLQDSRGYVPCEYNDCRGCTECRTRTGLRYVNTPVMEKCVLCSGVGYLREKPEPVIGIIDWKLS